ncbi:MAG: hypothetical protein ABI629_11340 [bacterium]
MLTIGAIAALSMFDVPAGAAEGCAGDCDGDGTVAINELVQAVSIALGSTPPEQCGAADANGDGTVTIAELIGSVNAALGGCGGEMTPTPVRTATPSPTGGVLVPGCDNGTFDVTYGNVSGGSNVVTSDLTLDVVAAGDFFDPRGPFYRWSITGLQCTENMPTFHRAVQIQFLLAPGRLAPGTYTLAPPLSYVLYQETQDNNVYVRAWDTTSATLTVESVDGDSLHFRIAGSMKPLPLYSFGQTPVGTFDLEVSGTVEHFTSQ